MGNITNLATTGNYATEVGDIKVSFNFQIDNESKARSSCCCKTK